MEKQNELKIVRNFNATKEQVWHAWSDIEHFKKWWGPMEYTCPDCEIDFRIGGRFLASMMDEKGNKIWSVGIYTDIVPYERIVFRDCFADSEGNIVSSEEYGMTGLPMEMKVTVLLKELNGKTEMTIIHEGLPEGEHLTGANTGWNSSLDKMEASFQ